MFYLLFKYFFLVGFQSYKNPLVFAHNAKTVSFCTVVQNVFLPLNILAVLRAPKMTYIRVALLSSLHNANKVRILKHFRNIQQNLIVNTTGLTYLLVGARSHQRHHSASEINLLVLEVSSAEESRNKSLYILISATYAKI